ncbi:MAG: BBP7 family outer membrane beta-barrel protein [Acetobacteraceae bacterium]
MARRTRFTVVFACLLTIPGILLAQEVRIAAESASWTSRLYGSVEYLQWWTKAAPLGIPLVSTGPVTNDEGFLLNGNTTILYGAPFSPASGGKATQGLGGFSGGRLTLGALIDPARGIAVEASGFGLADNTAGYRLQVDSPSLGAPGVRVPLYNTTPYFIGVPTDAVPAENGLPVSIPAIIGGQVRVTNRLSLWGLDAVGLYDLTASPALTVSALAGLRYLDLSEDFDLSDSFYGKSGPFVGQSGTVRDHFGTSNRFIGPTIGLRARTTWGRLSLTTTGRISVGDTIQELNVAGSYRAVNYTPSAGPEGIFAQPADSGRRTSNAIAVAPELQVKLGYDVTPSLRLTLGYDLLFLSSVVRPGDQLDRNIPKGQVFQQGGPAISTTSPARLFRTSDFHAQGLSAGVSLKF